MAVPLAHARASDEPASLALDARGGAAIVVDCTDLRLAYVIGDERC
jgi:hypothetical protein